MQLDPQIETLLARAKSLVPVNPVPPLPPFEDMPDVPQWHGFEHSFWAIGEQVRKILSERTKLRGNRALNAGFMAILRNRLAGRGRQTFVSLFAFRECRIWAPELAALLPDSDIEGHIVSALYKMKATGFTTLISPYLASRHAWIRKEARRYVSFDLDAPISNVQEKVSERRRNSK